MLTKTVTYLNVGILALLLGVGGSYRSAEAQPIGVSLTSQQQPVRVTLHPVYQYYDEGGRTIAEWSMPLVAVIPLQANMLLGVRTGVASVGGSNVPQVTGLSDLQATFSYTQSVGAGSIVLNLGANLPSGTSEFTIDEFETVTRLSQNFYAFRVPGLGQGFNVTPGLTWAVPVGEQVTVGLGASYQFKGSYVPVQGMEGRYNPGDEVQLTGGADIRLGETSALSGDLTLTLYGTDTIGESEQFGPGRKLSVTAQYLRHFGFNQVRILARYQSHAKSTVPVGLGNSSEEFRVLPNQGRAFILYRFHVQDRIDIVWRVDGHLYGETSVYDSKSLLSLGIQPEFSFENGWMLMPRFAYTMGSFSGVEAGLGFGVEF